MTGIDWVILVVCLAFAVWGYGQGLIVGAMSLAGFAGGAFAGSRIGPALLEGGSESPYAPLVALFGALLLGAIVAVGVEGMARALRGRVVRWPALGALDGAGGAALFAALGLAAAWLFGAVALNTPGLADVRSVVQRSAILQRLNDAFPPTGSVLRVLNRIDPTPQVTGPEADVPPPDRAILSDPDVEGAGASVVRVLGTACGLGVSGSGWVAAPEVVVTNAHVIAGEEDTHIETIGGTELPATPVHYDPRNDLAVLRVPGLDAPALALDEDPDRGADAAVLGYPENGPYSVSPARLGTTARVVSQDAYGRGPVRRRMTAFRARVRSGNSGGPVIGDDGRVLTTVFAASSNGKPPSGLGVPNSIVADALDGVGSEVDTGPCAA